MVRWQVERVVHFGPGDLCKEGFVHFGFHDRRGRHYFVQHQKHFVGRIGKDGWLEWTVSKDAILPGVPNIEADLSFPMYVDSLLDDTLVVSNFGNGRIYRVDPDGMRASLFIDGPALQMKDAGNCVVDDRGDVWVNEVTGCRVWRFNDAGRPIDTLGDGTPGFQPEETAFPDARFNWIYDIRRGPDGNIYVLDSRNFAVRMIDLRKERVLTLAGTGHGGYSGDGGPARSATFGSDPTARFDGPISLSVDEHGNLFVGDRFNGVVRRIDARSKTIDTIAGKGSTSSNGRNHAKDKEPLHLNLPKISSMDYAAGRLLVPTDLTKDSGDLAVLRESR